MLLLLTTGTASVGLLREHRVFEPLQASSNFYTVQRLLLRLGRDDALVGQELAA